MRSSLQLQFGLATSLLDSTERCVPLAFKVGRDQAIRRVDYLVVCSRVLRFVFRVLDTLLPVPSDDLLLLSDTLQGHESYFDSSGSDRVEKHVDDQLLDPSSAKDLTEEVGTSLAPQYPTNELPELSLAVTRVGHRHPATTATAIGETLEQCGSVAGRALGFESALRVVLCQLLPNLVVLFPADEAFVMIRDHDHPLCLGDMP